MEQYVEKEEGKDKGALVVEISTLFLEFSWLLKAAAACEIKVNEFSKNLFELGSRKCLPRFCPVDYKKPKTINRLSILTAALVFASIALGFC